MKPVAFPVIATFLIASCGQGQESQNQQDTQMADPTSAMPQPSPVEAAPPPPPAPSHNYVERDGIIYYYQSAVSDEQRKMGVAVGEVTPYAFLGNKDGKYVMAAVNSKGQVLGHYFCFNPCHIVMYEDGRTLGFDENSIIGAAFTDAFSGQLVIASETRPMPYDPLPSQTNHPDTGPNGDSAPLPLLITRPAIRPANEK